MASSLSASMHSLLASEFCSRRSPHSRPNARRRSYRRAAMSEPSLSPDGREIAFVSGGDIWTVPVAGGEARLLVSHPAYDSRPLYSPDGTKLAFMSTRTGNGDIYVLTLATGRLDRVTFDDVPEQFDAWSRDGKWIYFSSGSQDVNGMNDIFRVSASGGTPMAVSADRFTQEYWAAPSPADPNTIAFTATGLTRTTSGGGRVTATSTRARSGCVHFGGESPRYEAVTKDDAKDAWPMWSGDAKSLFYVSDKSGAENIWTTPPSGGAAKAVTSFTNGRVLWPTIVVRRQDDRVRARSSASGRSTSRAVKRGARADHAARRRDDARRSSIRRCRRASSRSRSRRTARRWRSSRTATCSRRRRATAATRRASRTRRKPRRSSRGRRTAAGSPTSRAATGRRTSSSTISARAPRRS